MPSDVPDARKIIETACLIDCPCRCPETVRHWEIMRKWLRQLALPKMRRDPAIRRGPVRHEKLTKAQAAEIWRLFSENPDMHQQEIAELVDTNSGRVSEVLNGLRDGV